MKNSFSLTIALPAQHLITYETKLLMFPCTDGYMGFMAGRQPLIAAMGPGLIHIVDIGDNDYWLGTTGGFCEMLNNQAILLCDSLIKPEDTKKLPPAKEKFYRSSARKMSEKEKIRYVTYLLREKLLKLEEEKQLKEK
ncbi:MAG: hypothetical protein Kow0029_07350 [Candidatus Rifleibacteriota bacterium]